MTVAPNSLPVCAVLVSWQPDPQFTQRVTRIREQVDAVIVVDNASSGAAAETIRQIASHTELLANSTNLGVAAALNRGLAQAQASGYQMALLLDQDSWLEDGMVKHMMTEWQAAASELPGVLGAGFQDQGRSESTSVDSTAGADRVDWVITSGSLIDIALWQQLGGFREDFFIDFVDTEYCQRVRKAGRAVLRTRAHLMQHHIGAHTTHRILGHTTHTSNHSANRRYYITRNYMVMLRESGRHPFGLWIPRGILASFKSIRRVVLHETGKFEKLTAIVQGWFDGIRGRMGERPVPPSPCPDQHIARF